MKILILNTAILAAGDLTETSDAIQSSDAIYPKHVIPGWQIVEAPVPEGFTPASHTWDGAQVVAKAPVAEPIAVPQSVSMRQARLALLGAGLLDGINAALAAMPAAAQIEWEYATEVRRDAPLIAGVQTSTGMTDAQIDALFVTAAGL